VAYKGKLYHIAQCNNVYIFPGLGLGLIATKASYASDAIFIEAAKILSKHSPMLTDPYGPLFPTLDTLRSVAREIGIGVSQVIFKEGHAQIPTPDSIEKLIDQTLWFPDYPHYA
jgi:malate dehydrogenase (oxaloacetate-decarboxylating)